MAEDRPVAEMKRAIIRVVNRRTQDIRRQQIGSELNAMKREINRPSQGFGQRRFSDTRHVLHQNRTTRQQSDRQDLQAVRLALDDRREVLLESVQLGTRVSQRGVGHGAASDKLVNESQR